MFFVVLGFYMALILHTTYSSLPVGHFYSNRLLRLFPTYWVVAISFLTISFVGFADSLPRNIALWAPSAHNFDGYLWGLFYLVVTNIFIIGQDLAAFIGFNHGLLGHEFLIVPQAWSLGAELWFYLAAPWLVRLRSRTILLFIFAGIIFRLRNDFSDLSGWPWNQRLTLTEYVYFFLGILSYRVMYSNPDSWVTSRQVGIIALLFSPLVVLYIGWLDLGRELDIANSVLMGIIAALMIPALFSLTKYSRLDRFLGEFSYPIYLIHLEIIILWPTIKESQLQLLFWTLAAPQFWFYMWSGQLTNGDIFVLSNC